MTPFTYERCSTVEAAVQAVAARPGARFLGGGTNLVDLMKLGVEQPAHLVDINALPLSDITETEGGGLRIGALVRNADLAWHPRIEREHPLVAQALLAGASPQLRNMATTGGNLLQRTRCHYFVDPAMPCNKRAPGSGCGALHGLNRQHAILGASEACVAVHPSDLCVAMAALEATVEVAGPEGLRSIAMADFHRLPGDDPARDHTLAPGELVLAVHLPPPRFAAHSAYLKLRDRASYAFALVSVAAALALDDAGRVVEARIALGGVAAKPWRDAAAEAMLVGAPPSVERFRAAADALLAPARGLAHNAFKIELARRAIVRALEEAAGHGPRQAAAEARP